MEQAIAVALAKSSPACLPAQSFPGGMFHNLHSGRYLAFNWTTCCADLKVVILDSPSDRDPQTPFAALLVPPGKEGEWMFSSESGHWQLLSSASAARLVVLMRNKLQRLELDQNGSGLEDEKSRLQDGVALRVSLKPKSAEQHVGVGACGYNATSLRWKERHCEQATAAASSGSASEHKSLARSTRKKKKVRRRRTATQYKTETLGKDEWTECEGEGHVNICQDQEEEALKKELAPLLAALAPESFSSSGASFVPFVSYDDNVLNRVIVEEIYSPLTGSMLVEDVEVLEENRNDGAHVLSVAGLHKQQIKLRRRLRFQRMPNLIQTEVSILLLKEGRPMHDEMSLARLNDKGVQVKVDQTNLVHKYLPPIVAGLVLAAPSLEACMGSGKKVRVLLIGVGGGALPIFLHGRLGFHVEAVDLDETVLGLAHRHFGLVEDEHLRVRIGDGVRAVFEIASQAINAHMIDIEMAEKWEESIKGLENLLPDSCSITSTPSKSEDCKPTDRIGTFDPRMNIIVVDVDAGDAHLGLSSPPAGFLEKRFLLACRIALQDGGMLAFNVVPCGTRPYKYVISALKEFFTGLYEIEIGGGENHVVFAFPTEIGRIDLDCHFSFLVKSLIDDRLLYQIIDIK